MGRLFSYGVFFLVAVSLTSPQRVSGQEAGGLDVKSSRVYTFVQGTGVGHSHAVEAKLLRGNLILGATSNAGSVLFDMKSFDVDTLRARKKLGLEGKVADVTRRAVNREMHGKAVLNTAKFPQASLSISAAKPVGIDKKTGLAEYELTGNFKLLGVTRPLKVNILVDDSEKSLKVTGEFTIKQTDYGIKPFRKAFGAVGVADELKISGDLLVAPSPGSRRSLEQLRKSS